MTTFRLPESQNLYKKLLCRETSTYARPRRTISLLDNDKCKLIIDILIVSMIVFVIVIIVDAGIIIIISSARLL